MKADHWPRRSKVPEIAGVERIHLESHADAGGVSTQVFHREWQLGIHPVQWKRRAVGGQRRDHSAVPGEVT
jgi:hypothetical protein